MAQSLSNLPVGAKVKFGKYSVAGETPQDITWLIVSKDNNMTTLLTEKIVDLRCYDAAEPLSQNSRVKEYGLARYDVSNIRQWLNSDANAGGWYTAQHINDQSPTNGNITVPTEYVNHTGFLHAFDTIEKRVILPTTLKCDDYEKGVINLVDKVFLPSLMEITGSPGAEVEAVEGTQFTYFVNYSHSNEAPLTEQAFVHSSSTSKPMQIDRTWVWWTRTGVNRASDSLNQVYALNTGGAQAMLSPNMGWIGVRPALNLSTTLSVSDTSDTEGAYTFLLNAAPNAPTTLNVPTIYGGKTNPIAWSSATDADGDVLTYHLECSINGGDYTLVYSGSINSYTHLVPFGTSSVSYRVKATDPDGESSGYTTSAAITVVNNNAPVISGTDTNLGVKSDDFTGTYTVTDANSDTVTVTEAIDGVQIRALVAKLGEEITYGVTETTWLALANGSHTLTISATDGIDTTVRTIVFTKLVDKFSIRNSTPWVSSTMPSRIMLVITRNIPSTSKFKVEVCNNGYDTSPTWEDCTDAVKSGLVHPFKNATKTATNWGVLVRVTVERNGAAGACYISAIGGNFE